MPKNGNYKLPIKNVLNGVVNGYLNGVAVESSEVRSRMCE